MAQCQKRCFVKLCKKHGAAELRHEGAELLVQHCQAGGSLPASEGVDLVSVPGGPSSAGATVQP